MVLYFFAAVLRREMGVAVEGEGRVPGAEGGRLSGGTPLPLEVEAVEEEEEDRAEAVEAEDELEGEGKRKGVRAAAELLAEEGEGAGLGPLTPLVSGCYTKGNSKKSQV
jgi:hypothetical protein